jgi:sugar/nucleoside kinase (ribokinase family)
VATWGGNVNPTLDLVTVGEAMALLIAQETGALSRVTDFSRATAGAELNVAVGIKRLGLSVGYISKVGADSFGKHLLAFLDQQGIDRKHVQIDPDHSTGFMLKSREVDGRDPTIEYFRRNSAASYLCLIDNPVDYCLASRHLHLTGISPALSTRLRELVFEMSRLARAQGRTISFDPNLRPRLWPSQAAMVECINRLAACSDLVMPGLAEGQLLTGQSTAEGIANFYLEKGVSQVVVKLGSQGAFVASKEGFATISGFEVETVVDTVGAGDGFAVGVISALLEGMSLSEAARRGNAIGARVVQFPGDCDGLPNRIELDEYVRRGSLSSGVVFV